MINFVGTPVILSFAIPGGEMLYDLNAKSSKSFLLKVVVDCRDAQMLACGRAFLKHHGMRNRDVEYLVALMSRGPTAHQNPALAGAGEGPPLTIQRRLEEGGAAEEPQQPSPVVPSLAALAAAVARANGFSGVPEGKASF